MIKMHNPTHIEEAFPDAERQLLIVLVSQALARIRGDSDMDEAVAELLSMLRKLHGTDTVLVARRAYASIGPKVLPKNHSNESKKHV